MTKEEFRRMDMTVDEILREENEKLREENDKLKSDNTYLMSRLQECHRYYQPLVVVEN